jgi:hypothetical protein
MKSVALKKLYDNNEMKKRMLNIALQKLTSMESTIRRNQQIKCVNNWEKMFVELNIYIKLIEEIRLFRYIRLALPRSNVRKWKFRLKTFREVNKLF